MSKYILLEVLHFFKKGSNITRDFESLNRNCIILHAAFSYEDMTEKRIKELVFSRAEKGVFTDG
ncbi:MAG: hypothetical protein U9Q18_00640 [Caldisericota bacterium]|nr:hypothetical protein [Caldisericota bacterium]